MVNQREKGQWPETSPGWAGSEAIACITQTFVITWDGSTVSPSCAPILQSGPNRLSFVLESLYAIDQEKADDLLHRPEAREKFDNDRSWFRALARSAKHNEKSMTVVNDIIESVAERRSEYRVGRIDAMNVALVLGADEHCQWVLGMIRDGDEVQKLHVLYHLMRHPKSILRDEDDRNIVINAMKEYKDIHDRIARSYHNYEEEGTIGKWLMSPNSPLRD